MFRYEISKIGYRKQTDRQTHCGVYRADPATKNIKKCLKCLTHCRYISSQVVFHLYVKRGHYAKTDGMIKDLFVYFSLNLSF